MIQFGSGGLDLSVRLTSKKEDLVIESEREDLTIYLSPMQAVKLWQGIHACLLKVDLETHGLTPEAEKAYAVIEKLRLEKPI